MAGKSEHSASTVPSGTFTSIDRMRLLLMSVIFGFALVCAGWAAESRAASYSYMHFGEHLDFVQNAEAGLVEGPVGIGMDATGDVYVSEKFGYRIDKFGPQGQFLLAWGWGVLDGKAELEVCTTFCLSGLPGSGAGQFDEPEGVAVDAGSGSVYVFDRHNHRVEKYDLSGKFELTFGRGVNKKGGNVCLSGEASECQAGLEGTGPAEFGQTAESRSYMAVGGAGGRVYVGDTARFQVFESNGTYLEEVSLSEVSKEGEVRALTVDGAGDVFVKIGGQGYPKFPPEIIGMVPGVLEFEREGPEKWKQRPVTFDTGNEIESLAADASGHLFVGDFAEGFGGFHVLEYDIASVEELSAFGFGTSTDSLGMATSDSRLCVTRAELENEGKLGTEHDLIWCYVLPEPGPLIEPGSVKATPEPRGAATFDGTVNPEGKSTKVTVEVADETHYKANEFKEVASSELVSSFSDQLVELKVKSGTLTPGVRYYYRLLASNSNGSVVSTEQPPFLETPAVLIEGPWVTEVTSTSAEFRTRLNPGGVPTEYKLEYGSSLSYGTTLSGIVAGGGEYVPIEYSQRDLSPDTVYHYRLIATNSVGTVETADKTFRTQDAVVSSGLLDGRRWELVSPSNKHAALIEPLEGVGGDIQAAADGSGIGYLANEPITPQPPGNAGSYVVSTRSSADAWGSFEILPSQTLPEGETLVAELGFGQTYPMLFSPDLARSVIEPDESVPVASLQPVCAGYPPATERTIVLRIGFSSACYVPLVTASNVPEGVHFGGSGSRGTELMKFLTGSPDLQHVVFSSVFNLTPSATSLVTGPERCSSSLIPCQPSEENLYEWGDGRLQQVNVLPEDEGGKPTFDAFIGHRNVSVAHTISADGRWVVWEYGESPILSSAKKLYARDMVEGKTVRLGGAHTVYETMSADGSRIFFLEGQRAAGAISYDLYVRNMTTGAETDVTGNHGPGEFTAGVQDAVVGSSEDGRTVYFVAKGVLAAGGEKGADNLYVTREEGGVWKIALVAILSADDEKDWTATAAQFQNQGTNQLQEFITSRVSPDGRFLAFMSDRSLTGYDNTDANSGMPDEEVYEYDLGSGRLACVSCASWGSRPAGVFDATGSLLVDRAGSWGGLWLAGSMSGWRVTETLLPTYQPRNLSDSGRLFFESPVALVSGDTNGLEDVYEYEPLLDGGCTSASPEFSELSAGCVGLISSGTSSTESAFYDSSGSGGDAFFVSTSKLVSADYDKSVDVYDARVCPPPVPEECAESAVQSPECSSSDLCKPPPTAQPEIFGPPPSQTFSGEGNLPSKSVKHSKAGRALRACKRIRARKRRSACERNARRRRVRRMRRSSRKVAGR